MYVDILGLVTIGVGCLIDPVTAATSLPFVKRGTKERVDASTIAANWHHVKDNADTLKHQHFKYAMPYTSIELTEEGVDQLMLDRLAASEAWLRKTFHSWDDMPADAQLGIVSMAWAAGAGFTAEFPRFTAAARAGDWAVCAEECKLREAGNPGVVPRNLADHYLFLCASVADSPTADAGFADTVHWQVPA
jgi:GH24 family phage-related lysozyme (muramidase)